MSDQSPPHDQSSPRKKKRARKKKRTGGERKGPKRAKGRQVQARPTAREGNRRQLRSVRNAVVAVVVIAGASVALWTGQPEVGMAATGFLLIFGMLLIAVVDIAIGATKGPISQPAFARDWPQDDELDVLMAAFEAGNFALVSERAPALAKSTTDDAVKAAALDLRRRIEPTPTSVFLWVLGVSLVVILYGYYLTHAH